MFTTITTCGGGVRTTRTLLSERLLLLRAQTVKIMNKTVTLDQNLSPYSTGVGIEGEERDEEGEDDVI